jgi:hypothetical protein
MKNGSNQWGVQFVRITWLERALSGHGNVASVSRRNDIVFDVTRNTGCPLTVLCLDEYVFGAAAAHRVFSEFPDVDFISVGGNWNGYTPEAKELCTARNIGLYNSSELTGAIWKEQFWTYHKRDDKGNPVYSFKGT